MLENMRKQGASMFIWVLFGLLIAGFVISFGPQSVGSSQGCKSSSRSTMLMMGDRSLDDSAYRFAYGFSSADEGDSREAAALTKLIRRELLATEAESRGLRASADLVDHVITDGRVHVGGRILNARGAFFDEEGKGVFQYKQFKNFTFQRTNLSIGGYKRQEAREILVTNMAGSVPASREEAEQLYIRENTTVSFDAVRFDPRAYADALVVTDADLDRYLQGHEADVKATYQDALWKGKKQVRVRRIFVAATPAPATGSAPTVDPARTKLEAARADIVAGRKKFADVATALDADLGFRARGGDWGWYDDGALTLPDPALNDAVKLLTETGKVSDVVSAGGGFYLLTAADRREGDLTFDQVKRSLAETVARPVWGQQAAKQAAEAAVVAATGGKHLTELFSGLKTGNREWISQDVPAAWMQTGSGTPTAPGAGAPTTGAATAVVPTAGAAAVPTAIAAAVPTAIEVLPSIGLYRPTVNSYGPVPRVGIRTPVGESAELARALFDELTSGAIGKQAYQVKSGAQDTTPSYVVVELTTKKLADEAEFTKNASTLVAELSAQRGGRYLSEWLRSRCEALVAKGAIRPRRELLTTTDDDGKRIDVPFAPCSNL
jgi:SurA N-terminal domain/PPIC-type PPIASE domain